MKSLGNGMITADRRFAIAGMIAIAMGACSPAPPKKFNGFDVTGANYARRLELSDVDGRMRTLDEFKGKVVVVFFGFTHCPDVCPTTLAELAQIKQALGREGEKLQGILVTVDPERDTPQVLKAYVASFDPTFIALRGSPEQTQATAKEFKVHYAKVPSKDGKSYTMDHTAGSYVFDAHGRIRLFTLYGSGTAGLKEDLQTLLQGG